MSFAFAWWPMSDETGGDQPTALGQKSREHYESVSFVSGSCRTAIRRLRRRMMFLNALG